MLIPLFLGHPVVMFFHFLLALTYILLIYLIFYKNFVLIEKKSYGSEYIYCS